MISTASRSIASRTLGSAQCRPLRLTSTRANVLYVSPPPNRDNSRHPSRHTYRITATVITEVPSTLITRSRAEVRSLLLHPPAVFAEEPGAGGSLAGDLERVDLADLLDVGAF